MKTTLRNLSLAVVGCASSLSFATDLTFWSWRVEDKAFYEMIAKEYKAVSGDDVKFSPYKNTEYAAVLSAVRMPRYRARRSPRWRVHLKKNRQHGLLNITHPKWPRPPLRSAPRMFGQARSRIGANPRLRSSVKLCCRNPSFPPKLLHPRRTTWPA